MIKRKKIIIIIAIVLISSSMAFVFILQGGPVTASEKEINDAELPSNTSQTKKTNKGDGSVLDSDSLYNHLSNRQTKVDDKLQHDKDSLALLTD